MAKTFEIFLLRLLLKSVGGLLVSSAFVNLLYYSKLPEPRDTLAKSLHSPPLVRHTNHTLWTETKSHQVEKRDKNGHIVHHKVTSIHKEDLEDVGEQNPAGSMTIEQASKGREELLAILEDSGVDDIDAESISKLPLWSEVLELYGDGPVVYGLESCQKFRDEIPPDDATIGTAGLFNTGTNPFSMYLEANCVMPQNKNDKHGGMRWQVPWGKHMLAERRLTNTAKNDKKVNKTNVLPVALIRDPFSWMQSMCHHPYQASWSHHKDHCPNLVPNEVDKTKFKLSPTEFDSVNVTIKYPVDHAQYESLVHFWSDWYRQYIEADFPRLIVRLEDLIFHQKELISTVCECAGAVPKQESFTYIVDAGKWGQAHKGSSNMISAMIKYGSCKNRFHSLTEDDMRYATDHLDEVLMDLFQYAKPHT